MEGNQQSNQQGNQQGSKCGEHEVRLNRLDIENDKQWDAINQLQNRLPVWATVVISMLTFLLGASLTYAGLR
jgi:hypothetical protein